MSKSRRDKKKLSQQIRTSTNLPTPVHVPSVEEEPHISCDSVAEIVLEVWRLKQRAEREGASERIVAAIDRTEDRLRRLGFETDTMQSLPYSENLRVKVIEHVDADGPRGISQCLTPAVYFAGKLIRVAEVVTKGRE